MKANKTLVAILSVVGAIAVIAAAVFFLLRYLNNRAHDEKWEDYYECGIL